MNEEYGIRPDEEDVIHNYVWKQKREKKVTGHVPIQTEVDVKCEVLVDSLSPIRKSQRADCDRYIGVTGYIPADRITEFYELLERKINETFNEIYEIRKD